MKFLSTFRLKLCRSACRAAIAAGVLIAPGSGLAQDGDAGQYYPTRVFGGFNGGEMNISVFVFRDINTDGQYDMGDRPFANIAVKLGNAAVVRSNISGFANFRASALQRDREIVQPGFYRFSTVPPPGWRITTGNQEQPVRMEVLLGAPGDMVAAAPAEPVGLAPELEIRGRIQAPGDVSHAAVTVSGPGAEAQNVAVDQLGSFASRASPGLWQIETQLGGETMRRRVEVRGFPVALSLRRPSGTEAAAAVDRKVTSFDDLIASESVAKIPNGYGSLNWHNWVVTHNRTYGGEGYINGTLSGEYVAYNGSGHPVSIDSKEPFDFLGGHFTAAWADAEGEMLEVAAWRGDQLAYKDSVELSALGPVYLAAEYQAITRLEFSTTHYWQVVADDLVFAFPQHESAAEQSSKRTGQDQ